MPDNATLDTLTKSVTEIGDKLVSLASKADIANVVNKADIQPLQDQVNGLIQKVKEIKVGDDNRTKDTNHGYKHYGEYAQAVMKFGESHGTVVDERIKVARANAEACKSLSGDPFAVPQPPAFSPVVRKAAGDGVAQSGDPFAVGLLFKPHFAAGLTSAYPDQADDLLSLVRMVPIDASAESITLDYVDDADRSGGAVRGGMTAAWKSELTQLSEVKPKIRNIKLEPQELYCFAYASDKSLRNSPIALGAFLQDGMRDAVRFKIGDAIVNGDGAGKPRGLLSSPDKINTAKSTSQLAASLNEDNIAKMWKRMPAAWRGDAVWLMNQDCEDQLDLFTRTGVAVTALANQTGLPSALYSPDRQTLKGRPIKFCEYCQTLGTVGDVILWSPKHYLVAVKTGQGPEMSMHLKFDFAQTAFRFIFEIDGRSEFPTVLTPFKGSVTRSAIGVLDTRS